MADTKGPAQLSASEQRSTVSYCRRMKPLDGIKVLEFSTMITASFAAMVRAEEGAEVSRVERLERGDLM